MKRSFKNILTMVMIATMVLGNSFLVSAHETEQYASCSHSLRIGSTIKQVLSYHLISVIVKYVSLIIYEYVLNVVALKRKQLSIK